MTGGARGVAGAKYAPDQSQLSRRVLVRRLSGAAKLYGGDCFTGGIQLAGGNGLYPKFQ